MSACTSRLLKSTLAAAMAGITFLAGLPSSMAADHGDGPFASVKRSGDLNDLYVFLDPNDNSRVIVILTAVGFTVPGEAVNFSVFDHELVFEFQFETTGDARPDRLIQVRFSPKRTSGATPQTATVTLPNGKRFKAPTTPSNLTDNSPSPTVSARRNGILFFAGSADDPFFFDIPGFNRFVGSVLGGAANPALLERGRDTFAGYNTLAIAFSFPVAFFRSIRDNVLGVTARVFNPSVTLVRRQQIDRVATPAVNVALIPFPLKDAHNRASTLDDAAGKFAPAIIGTLRALGTNQAGIDTLAGLAVTHGDFVRVNTTIPNTGPGGGDNPGAAFPNGRRLGDDVIDTVVNVVTNGGITTGDHVNGNDRPRRDVFPFLGQTQQPRVPGTIDDDTRN